KQVYVANKARSIARPPFNPLRNTLDFLDDDGHRLVLTEEIPLYTTMLALGYRLFGERDDVGHALSLLGSLLAILALYDLAKREQGERVALLSALMFTSAPLFVFYGRAVLADPWMLAGLLASAAAYRRFLDGQGRLWLAAAALAGLLAVAFKYFGLMVLIVLIDMTRRSAGWRACWKGPLVLVAMAMVVPTALWMALVFLQSPNPVASGWSVGQEVYPYLIIQAPGVLLDRNFYHGLLVRFPLHDFGPVASALMLVGILATLRRRVTPGPLAAWTLMGLLFYVALGPKLIDHDYYELMLLPAASLWAGWGVEALLRLAGRLATRHPAQDQAGSLQGPPSSTSWRAGGVSPLSENSIISPVQGLRPSAREQSAIRLPVQSALLTILLASVVLVQGPWAQGEMFRLDAGKVALADRMRQASRPSDRVLVIGPGIALVTVVHYSGREGWAERCLSLPDDWRQRIDHCRARGASLVAVYLDPKNADARNSFQPLFRAFPQVEHLRSLPGRDPGHAEFVLLKLPPEDPARLASQAPARNRP
ncbi:MAG TPA: glycosyltransferase family 39 protein, partial [Isosphaeraceae bacterium]|nr:glycosyltransferase family 39 protein [Isosphaeraceae bacterium]